MANCDMAVIEKKSLQNCKMKLHETQILKAAQKETLQNWKASTDWMKNSKSIDARLTPKNRVVRLNQSQIIENSKMKSNVNLKNAPTYLPM